MGTPNRIYVVTPTKAQHGTAPRLVRAPNQARALHHVAQDFTVEVAGQDDLVTLIGAGVKVETAGEKQAGDEAKDDPT